MKNEEKMNRNKKEMKLERKLLLIGIILISIISLIFLVSALTSDERQSLNDELNNLTDYLTNNNYGWLTDYNLRLQLNGNVYKMQTTV